MSNNGLLDRKDWYSVARLELSSYLQVSTILVAALGLFAIFKKAEITAVPGRFLLIALVFLFAEILIVMYAIRNERKIAYSHWGKKKPVNWRQKLDSYLRNIAFFLLLAVSICICISIYSYLGFSIMIELNWVAIGAVATFFAALIALINPYLKERREQSQSIENVQKALMSELVYNLGQLFSLEDRPFKFDVTSDIDRNFAIWIKNEDAYHKVLNLYSEMMLFDKERSKIDTQKNTAINIEMSKKKEEKSSTEHFSKNINAYRIGKLRRQLPPINYFLEFVEEDMRIEDDFGEDDFGSYKRKITQAIDLKDARRVEWKRSIRKRVEDVFTKVHSNN